LEEPLCFAPPAPLDWLPIHALFVAMAFDIIEVDPMLAVLLPI
jgi:hypothetical protein